LRLWPWTGNQTYAETLFAQASDLSAKQHGTHRRRDDEYEVRMERSVFSKWFAGSRYRFVTDKVWKCDLNGRGLLHLAILCHLMRMLRWAE
jgi:hypothetical protein